jgi:hypothetical protein
MSRSLLARSLTVLGLLVSVLSLAGSATAASAAPAASEPPRTWSSSTETVCVESHVGKAWGVRGALRQWNRLSGGPDFVLQARCADYEGTVTVRFESSSNRFTGWTDWYWDESGYLVHADVTVNPERLAKFARGDQSCMGKHTTTHEFGHVLGLRHYPHSHSGAVMSYLGWQRRCGALNGHDRSDFRELYPEATSG